MTSEPPLTPDVDLPGQPQDHADLDIEVQPEPDAEQDPAPAESNDPELGNTLIRPDNS